MPSKFKDVTHVIFDMDGLLLNTEVLYTVATQNILDMYFQNPRKIYTWDVKVGLMGLQTEQVSRKIVDIYDIPITWEEYAALAGEQIKILMKNCEKCAGAERLVKHLYDKNVPICLATSSSKESFDVKTVHHKELFKMFQHITMGSSDPEVAHGKPAPDIFLVAASRFPDKPKHENCLVFEDAPNGVTAALAAGMQVVMVPDIHVPESQRQDATQVLKTLNDFKPEDFNLPAFDES
ncbi:unnamed protein product [Chironomus riparius]|uniref:Pseudouridine-5'-phosphatase n=1 Tax=Chironomus riparius TaxID=315576 RepID=A0A9N9SBB2_9DIPT|nr:unnamed protein product [Chironomus riparius]